MNNYKSLMEKIEAPNELKSKLYNITRSEERKVKWTWLLPMSAAICVFVLAASIGFYFLGNKAPDDDLSPGYVYEEGAVSFYANGEYNAETDSMSFTVKNSTNSPVSFKQSEIRLYRANDDTFWGEVPLASPNQSENEITVFAGSDETIMMSFSEYGGLSAEYVYSLSLSDNSPNDPEFAVDYLSLIDVIKGPSIFDDKTKSVSFEVTNNNSFPIYIYTVVQLEYLVNDSHEATFATADLMPEISSDALLLNAGETKFFDIGFLIDTPWNGNYVFTVNFKSQINGDNRSKSLDFGKPTPYIESIVDEADSYFISNSDAVDDENYLPVLRLSKNGSFMMLFNTLDSMGRVFGTYEVDGDNYSFTVSDSDFYNDKVTGFQMTLSGDTFTYLGENVGATDTGSVFKKSSEVPASYTRATIYPRRALKINKNMNLPELVGYINGNISVGMTIAEVTEIIGVTPIKVNSETDSIDLFRFDILAKNGYYYIKNENNHDVDYDGLKNGDIKAVLMISPDIYGNVKDSTIYFEDDSVSHKSDKAEDKNQSIIVTEKIKFLTENISAEMTVDELTSLTGAKPVNVLSSLDGRDLLRFDIGCKDDYNYTAADGTDSVDFDALINGDAEIIMFVAPYNVSGLEYYAMYFYYGEDETIYEDRGDGINPVDNLIRPVYYIPGNNKAVETDTPEALPLDISLVWPLESKYWHLTEGFGYDELTGIFHNGIDIRVIEGADVYAAAAGTVKYVGCDEENGNYIIIDHGSGITTFYAHLETYSLAVRTDDIVRQGDIIGNVGNTGMSTGPHLHFEIRNNDFSVNPLDMNMAAG